MKRLFPLMITLLLAISLFSNDMLEDSLFYNFGKLKNAETVSLNCTYEGGWYDDVGRVLDLWAVDTFLFVCDFYNGTRVFSIAIPDSPVLLATVCNGGYSQRISYAGDVIYVADRNPGVTIISIKDPGHPIEIGSYWTTDNTYGVCAYNPGASKSEPNFIGSYNLLGKMPFLCSTDRYAGLSIYSTLNYRPVLRSTVLVGANYCNNVAVHDHYAYVATWYDGMKIVDVHNPIQPQVIGTVTTNGFSSDLFIDGETLYLCDGGGDLRIFDISDPTDPDEIGYCPTRYEALDVYVINDRAFIACEYGGISVYDVSNPASPVEIAYYSDGSAARGIFAVDDYIYVGAQYSGLDIYKYTESIKVTPLQNDNNLTTDLDLFDIIEIYDLNGRLIEVTDDVQNVSYLNDYMKNSARYKNGIYLYKTVSENSSKSGKILIMK